MMNRYEKLKKLGLNVAYYRNEKGIKQEQLAEMIEISRTHMSRIENGLCSPSLKIIFAICDKLEITEEQLFSFR